MDSTVGGLGPAEEKVLVAIGELALRFARDAVDRETASDVAQDVVLICLKRKRARVWTVDASEMEMYVRCLVRRRVVDSLRRRQRRGERDAEHARDRLDSAYEWMEPELALEAEWLEAFRQSTFDALPSRSRRTWALVREKRISYKAAAKELGVSARTVCSDLTEAERFVRKRMRANGLTSSEE